MPAGIVGSGYGGRHSWIWPGVINFPAVIIEPFLAVPAGCIAVPGFTIS
jgi:hypothetical protein